MGLNNRNVIASFLLLFTGGATFFLYPNWLILPVTAFSWFLLEVHFVSNPRMGRITHALILGLFLLAFARARAFRRSFIFHFNVLLEMES